jgi:adenine/guanine phosphoribosyltransferase-like PRPP-binding protein
MSGVPVTGGWKGLNTGRMPLFIGYDQAERMVAALLERARRQQLEAVVAIARGGLVPGTMASCMLALPLHIIGWERATAKVSWIGPRPKARHVLLVDDCCASGATLQSVTAALRQAGYEPLTLTITHDPETTQFIPDLSYPVSELFRFPWERGEATPRARALRATGAAASRETEAPFIGFDPAAEGKLPERFRDLPQLASDNAVIITGLAECDEDLVRSWLLRVECENLPVEMRPPSVAPDAQSVAHFKAGAATRWGCTHFFETDAEQAIRIAACAPHLIVGWWPASAKAPLILGAAAVP